MTMLPSYRVEDPQELASNLLKLFEESTRAMSDLIARSDGKLSPYSAASEMAQAAAAVADIAGVWLLDPDKLVPAQGRLLQSYLQLWENSVRRLLGESVEPLIEPEVSDNRFKDQDWSTPYFDFWKQAYLITSRWAEDMLKNTEGLDAQTRRQAEFHFRQISSALSPSNFPLTNPEVVRETFATNAKNLLQGMTHFAEDMEKSGDLLKISQTDLKAFEVGKNLAVTPGKVIFQNELLQLIQYAPTTDKVRELPLLIVPPWINKFYILDLTPAKSLIRFLVGQGFTVFMISWVNPDKRLSHKSFEDYMQEGLLTAANAVRRETGLEQCNVAGYCVGGTLLATTLAYLAARGDEPFASASFLTTQVDFTHAGDLLLFTGKAQLAALEEMMAERGYLDGSRMANVFNMLRPRDLIWPYIVNNYLLGKKPFPFDLLYWNQDSTRMPAANHSFYLREFYGENRLAKKQMTLSGTRLDMGKVKLPVFELATKEDHIAPAKSVFTGASLLAGPVEFVLSGSGHIAGVINPPDKVKYQYWTSRIKAETLEKWLEGAVEHPGSWWPYWSEWLAEHSGEFTAPRKPGEQLGVIEDAPGTYVKTKA